ncbi:MAG TPA: UDP-N-acetylmuramate--L-alanine ligase [Anaerolineales bacterium]|nr:UDP-N-acetylmuramate--L-alanine ligase [Anaerolineales bacterium]
MLNEGDHIHLIGIGGAGLSAIARVLHARGFHVTGSDREHSPAVDELRAHGIPVAVGHAAENLGDADVVIRSSAIPDGNVEVAAAGEAGVPVFKRADILAGLTAGKTTIAVAGTHGKTTTTAMTAWLLSEGGLDPSYIVGGEVAGLGSNARAGAGPHFVIEADEYDRMFHGLQPGIAVVTNVEHDHPDLYPTEADFVEAFDGFVDRIAPDGTLVVWGDSEPTRRLAARVSGAGRTVVPYGFGPENDLRADRLEPVPGQGFAFDLVSAGATLGRIRLSVPGEHNALNASAAAAVGMAVGLPFDAVAMALGRFTGAVRRFEVLGEAGGVIVVDDYAHHPTEIRATIAAARDRYPDRTVWVAWQPHTYSRIGLLCGEFAASFSGADHVVVTGVYAARESAPAGFSLSGLLAAMQHSDARLIESLDAVAADLAARIEPGSVLLVLSAGDANRVSAQVLRSLSS